MADFQLGDMVLVVDQWTRHAGRSGRIVEIQKDRLYFSPSLAYRIEGIDRFYMSHQLNLKTATTDSYFHRHSYPLVC